MRAKITRRLLTTPATLKAGEVWDSGDESCPGFYARHRGLDGSRWRYALKYRIGGRIRHHAIAEDGAAIPPDICERLGLTAGASWNPEAARREAERVRGALRHGQDPDSGREVPTLRVFAERYLRDHAAVFKKPRSVEEDRGLFTRHLLPEWGDFRLDRIDAAGVARFVQARKGKPVTANRALALLSHVYTKAGEWGLIPRSTNPVRGVPRFREQHRTRFLSAEELARLGSALRELEDEGRATPEHAVSPFALAAVRVLMFTGMRPGEALSLRWENVDLKAGLLSLPDSKSGAKTVHLNPAARKVLSKLPRLEADDRVFPPRRQGAAEADLESAWRRVRDRAQLDGVRLYDAARHTFASIGVMSGASLYLVGGLLGHKKATTTSRYAHVGAGPLEALSADLGRRVAAALDGRKGRASKGSGTRRRP